MRPSVQAGQKKSAGAILFSEVLCGFAATQAEARQVQALQKDVYAGQGVADVLFPQMRGRGEREQERAEE